MKDQKAATGESEDEDKDDDDDDDDISEPTQEQCMLAFYQFEFSMRPKTLCRICCKDRESQHDPCYCVECEECSLTRVHSEFGFSQEEHVESNSDYFDAVEGMLNKRIVCRCEEADDDKELYSMYRRHH